MSDELETVFPLPIWIVLLIVVFCWPSIVFSEPRFQVSNKDITITLFDDPCELKDQISNLPFKAEWKEGAKTYRGCWGPRPDVEAVLFYFDDKTMGAIPFGAIHKVVGA
jgi:hypothetical protein